MIYYEDYRLKIIETDGKYTVYDEKIGGRAYHVNKSKEWIDEYIQRVQSKRKRKPGRDITESKRIKNEVCDNCKAALKDKLTPEQLEIFEDVFNSVSEGYVFKRKEKK